MEFGFNQFAHREEEFHSQHILGNDSVNRNVRDAINIEACNLLMGL